MKKDPYKRWRKPDRIFFGFGACHILAGVYLAESPLSGFYAEWIVPKAGFSGTHIYVTNGPLAFDFHGYSRKENLLKHYWKGWQRAYPGWEARVEKVDFPLLDTAELNRRKHLGPDQYYGDPVARAKRFLNKINHENAFYKALEGSLDDVIDGA